MHRYLHMHMDIRIVTLQTLSPESSDLSLIKIPFNQSSSGWNLCKRNQPLISIIYCAIVDFLFWPSDYIGFLFCHFSRNDIRSIVHIPCFQLINWSFWLIKLYCWGKLKRFTGDTQISWLIALRTVIDKSGLGGWMSFPSACLVISSQVYDLELR